MSKDGLIVIPNGAGNMSAVVKDLMQDREILRENLRRAAASIEEMRRIAQEREEQRAAASILLGLAIMAAGGELRVTKAQQREMRGRKARIVRSQDEETGDYIWRVEQ